MRSVTIQDVLSDASLFAAWDKVRTNKGCAGIDGQTIEDFEADLVANLSRLKKEILEGTYKPLPLLRVDIPKRSGGTRVLSIPCVRDRVLQTAVAQALTPIFEAEFEDCSFAYRPGRSVDRAVARIVSLRDEGYRWVVDADIDDFFDEIDHALLMAEVEKLVSDHSILGLIRSWIKAETLNSQGEVHPGKGIPQGSPLSPLLANLYLDHLDEALLKRGLRLVRYADDFIVLCRNREKAEEALELSEDVLKALELDLNEAKTRIVEFDQGFRFLGVQFIRSLVFKARHAETDDLDMMRRYRSPEGTKREEKRTAEAVTQEKRGTGIEGGAAGGELSGAGAGEALGKDDESGLPYGHDPRLRTLYLLRNGYVLGKASERLVIKYNGEVLKEVPAISVDQVMVYGNSQVTTQAMRFCLERSIPIFLLSGSGRYYGAVDSFGTEPVLLHQNQFARAQDPEFCLCLAREFIRGKILNTRVVLLRYARKRDAPALEAAASKLAPLARTLDHAADIDQIRGIEGVAARTYFDALASTLSPGWGFKGREKRPPPDPVNVLLSFGYTILFFNVYSLLKARGLNPHVGFLHPVRRGHPGLASDLMEEFRAIVVDAVVLNLVFNNKVRESDFEKVPGGKCRIKETARQVLIRALEAKFNSRLTHPVAGLKMDYRRCIEYQVNHVASLVSGKDRGPYRPVVLR